jgi:hypothetical protein
MVEGGCDLSRPWLTFVPKSCTGFTSPRILLTLQPISILRECMLDRNSRIRCQFYIAACNLGCDKTMKMKIV